MVPHHRYLQSRHLPGTSPPRARCPAQQLSRSPLLPQHPSAGEDWWFSGYCKGSSCVSGLLTVSYKVVSKNERRKDIPILASHPQFLASKGRHCLVQECKFHAILLPRVLLEGKSWPLSSSPDLMAFPFPQLYGISHTILCSSGFGVFSSFFLFFLRSSKRYWVPPTSMISRLRSTELFRTLSWLCGETKKCEDLSSISQDMLWRDLM